MANIEKRNIQRELGDEFIYWAEDYFVPEQLNQDHEKNKLLEAYKATMPAKFADLCKMRNFKEKLQKYCAYKGYIFNPPELLKTPSEQERNEIRKYEENKDLYFFHIRTTNFPAPQTTSQSNDENDGDDGDFSTSENEYPEVPF